MFTTKEYSRLTGIDCEDVTLIPYESFEAFEGNYKVMSSAFILNVETKETIRLNPGQVITGIGTVKKIVKRKPAKKKAEDSNREAT